MDTHPTSRRLQIVTASWFTALPPHFLRVSISRGSPRGQRGFRKLSALAPGSWCRSANEAEYVRLFTEQLAQLEPGAIYDQLNEMAHGVPKVALCCFERPGANDGWCHRSLAATWLAEGLDIAVPEFGFENFAMKQHPMLPPSLK